MIRIISSDDNWNFRVESGGCWIGDIGWFEGDKQCHFETRESCLVCHDIMQVHDFMHMLDNIFHHRNNCFHYRFDDIDAFAVLFSGIESADISKLKQLKTNIGHELVYDAITGSPWNLFWTRGHKPSNKLVIKIMSNLHVNGV